MRTTTRMRTMMKRNESHPHKTVICRMCVTRRSGEQGGKRLAMNQQHQSRPLLPKLTQERCLL